MDPHGLLGRQRTTAAQLQTVVNKYKRLWEPASSYMDITTVAHPAVLLNEDQNKIVQKMKYQGGQTQMSGAYFETWPHKLHWAPS